MGIKRFNVMLKLMLCIILITIISIGGTFNIVLSQTHSIESQNVKSSSIEEILVDKVYNLTLAKPYINFSNNIYFEKPFIYYISFQIVTPHTCHINISLWDPDNDKYDIYDSRGGVQLVQFEKPEIPFGVAITGNYTITFRAYLTKNLNIHIKIVKDQYVCLQDTIEPSEFGRRVLYEVNKFYNQSVILHNLTLKTDWLYRFYFGRYSPIASSLDSNTTIDFNITSSNDINYKIYVNVILPGVCEVKFFDFGTAVEGTYNVIMTVYNKVKCVNIAYTIIDIDKIADDIDPNDPDPPPDDGAQTNDTKTGIETFIPREWTIGMIIFVGSAVGIPILIVVYRKKKNPTGI